MGDELGLGLGFLLGYRVGCLEGDGEGFFVGKDDGDPVGFLVGS